MVVYEKFGKSLEWRGGTVDVECYHLVGKAHVYQVDVVDFNKERVPVNLRKNAKAFVKGASGLQDVVSGDTVVKVRK